MKEAKRIWEQEFDWPKWEARVNEVMPQYIAEVESKNGDESYKIHFAGVWSKEREAVPLLLLHGWPGAFTEFLPLVEILKKSTNPPFHIIIPSLPGYAFSSRPPVDHDFTMWDVAGLMDNLMQGLGFGGGYIVQGGDLGSWLSVMMTHNEGCDGILLNMFVPGMLSEPLPTHDWADVTPEERAALMRAEMFGTTGSAYALMHATRPSTIGHVLAASPLALLAWVGEKYLDWTELDPPIESILELVSLYWFTETYPTSIYAYRQIFTATDHGDLTAQNKIKKPFGVSWFPYDLLPYPKAWTAKYGELVYFKYHKRGGHWPMMEVPEEFAEDIVEFALALGELKRKNKVYC
ncbi:alpha/beta-hydrolase [Ascodesmis nigricans]|uniref:Alpha/beta-hydrolase n=1 Tax=Ascodesmis nigricans TaxID=341454 RepID=A0A4V6RHG4_9PEZI|nr:alpha/beta-hydrolase [Ascodesmis nigricans]